MPKSPPIQAKGVFDPRAFLGRAEAGKTIEKYQKNQKIFNQGDIADSVFLFKKARSRSRFHPSKARKRSSGFWRRANSLAKVVLRGRNCVSRRPVRWKNAFSLR